jgi:hypothetical protein
MTKSLKSNEEKINGYDKFDFRNTQNFKSSPNNLQNNNQFGNNFNSTNANIPKLKNLSFFSNKPKLLLPAKKDLIIQENSDSTIDSNIIINQLKQSIKNVKNEYKNLSNVYVDEIKQKNEAQQLLQKCIEDLKFEISKTMKDISNYNKLHLTLNKKNGFEELLNAKTMHLTNLENKLKILTFVYDNGFQNAQMKKNKLFQNS